MIKHIMIMGIKITEEKKNFEKKTNQTIFIEIDLQI